MNEERLDELREICYLHNNETFSKNPEITKTGILSARLTIKAKEKYNEKTIRIT